MNELEQMLVLLLAIIAIFPLYYLGRILVSEIIVLFFKTSLTVGGFLLKKSTISLNKADHFLNLQDYDKAIHELKKAFFLTNPQDLEQINKIKQHHQNILSRIILLGEDSNCRFENISRLEHLLLERTELQNLLIKANSAFSEIRMRRSVNGKSLPKWGKQEYQEKIKLIETQLKNNKSNLESEIHKLSSYLKLSPRDRSMLQ
ncbi:MAG: hypothetical protein IT292_05720 [Deltaproteobacteria bacterium]|nr:hypothetical protein [Deltaproteobacteria bacterium]